MSLIGIESLLAAASLLIALVFPDLGSEWFSRAEMLFGKLARKRRMSVLLCGCSALLLRALLLPVKPVPIPFIQDEFSYLLAADTFAHGRLTNPPHRLWIHFETYHVIFQPTYASKFPPLQGLVLAFGKLVGGHPFVGVWLSVGAMCAAICWMLQAWLPPTWALLGGLIPVMRFGVFSYWDDSYWGGAVAAIGGCLVLGALPRIVRRQQPRDAMMMAIGIAILANTRPYEGLVLTLAAVGFLLWTLGRENRKLILRTMLVRSGIPAMLLLVLVTIGMGYYFWRVTESPFRMPYSINQAQYSAAGYFVWQSPHSAPIYHHQEISNFYLKAELPHFLAGRTFSGFLRETALKIVTIWVFFIGPALTVPLLALLCTIRDRRLRGLIIVGAVSFAATSLFPFFYAHYSGPIAGIILAVILQCMRHERTWTLDGRAVGPLLVRSAVVICVVMVPFRVVHMLKSGEPQPGIERARVAAELSSLPGEHLAIVRYSQDHPVLGPDWVDNDADIDGSKIVWARDMGADQNRELLDYYKNRRVWLIEPDYRPPRVRELAASDIQLNSHR